MVIMLLGSLNKCVSVCTSRKVPMTVKWEADFHPKSLSFPPTPPLGFVLIPSPALLLNHLLSILKCMCQLVCVCRTTGMHNAPLSLLCSKFTPSCPYSQCQFLPCSFVNVCSAGLIKPQQGLALLPAHSAIWSLKGILLLPLLHSPRLFFQSVRDSCSRPRSCESLLRIFCWILLGFREVWDKWCML